MLRAIVDFVVLMLVFAVLRSVVSAVMRGMAGGSRADRPSGPSTAAAGGSAPGRAPRQDLNVTGELRQDPVCGTYVPVDSSLHQNVNGRMQYFCSQSCLDRFKAA